MGHMNRNTRPSLSEEALSRNLIDPRTGAPLRPLGVFRGVVKWPIMGASPDDPSSEESGSDGEAGSTTGDGDDDPEDNGSKSTDSSGDSSDKDPQAKITALEAEKARHVRRRQEAEQARDAAQRELEEIKGKDTPDLEKAQKDNEKLTQENATLSSRVTDLALENAFLKDNTYSWHNPGRALKLADLSNVEIDDDGTVHGLKEALEALSKSDAYLLKTEKTDKSDADDAPDTSGKPNPGKKKDSKAAEDEKRRKLHDKYPSLRR